MTRRTTCSDAALLRRVASGPRKFSMPSKQKSRRIVRSWTREACNVIAGKTWSICKSHVTRCTFAAGNFVVRFVQAVTAEAFFDNRVANRHARCSSRVVT